MKSIITKQKKTKIVCTIGPASQGKDVLRELIKAGADVFRLNFSHGDHDFHKKTVESLRELGFEMGSPFGLLADLSGPKLRIGEIRVGKVSLAKSQEIYLTSESADGTGHRFQVNFSGFHEVVQKDQRILLDDGKIQLQVLEVRGTDVRCVVLNGGVLRPKKGVNLPDTNLPIPAMTEKDRLDLAFALEQGVDAVALSFVREPQDLLLVKEEMNRLGRTVPLFAKIEKGEALICLEEIIEIADGIMVARGDLGIEVAMEQVPTIQKRIIRLCNRAGKPVITATQMLESMIHDPRPTRAEVTDVYNAIIDGSDAVMLSGETAVGLYPVETVRVMDSIAGEAEECNDWDRRIDFFYRSNDEVDLTDLVCSNVILTADRLNLDLIIVPTMTGYSARRLSRYRPKTPIFACSVNTSAVNPLCFSWGVVSRLMSELDAEEVAHSESDALVSACIRTARHYGFIEAGMQVAVVGGVPLRSANHVNFMRIVDID